MSNSVIDEFKNIGITLAQRASSPLLASFAISFVLINWELVVLLFWGDSSGAVTRYEVHEYLASLSTKEKLEKFACLPLISTFIYLFIYPLPARWVYSFHKRQSEKLISLKNEIEGKRLLTLDESNALRIRLQEMNNSFAKLLEDKEQEILDLKAALNQDKKLNNEVAAPAEVADNARFDKEFLSFMDKPNFKVFSANIDNLMIGVSPSFLNSSVLADLKLLDLLRSNGTKYVLSDKGKYFAKKIKGF